MAKTHGKPPGTPPETLHETVHGTAHGTPHTHPTGTRPQTAPPELLRAARAAAGRAYAPYSGFRVGAAALDSRGVIFRGANVENASFPLGICAERVALQSWRQEGGTEIRAIAIYAGTMHPIPPCGACRDAILKWAPAAAVYLICAAGTSGPFDPARWLPAQQSHSREISGERSPSREVPHRERSAGLSPWPKRSPGKSPAWKRKS